MQNLNQLQHIPLLISLMLSASFFPIEQLQAQKKAKNNQKKAQNQKLAKRPTGLVMDEAAYNKMPRLPRFEGSKFSELPLKVDLRPYTPEIGDQGDIQSCVGWSVGYAALTIQRAIQQDWKNKQIADNAYSALFIYNQVKVDDCFGGARIEDALKFLSKQGDCQSRDFDTEADDCEKEPSTELIEFAQDHAIDDYITLFASNDEPRLKVFKTKQSLAQKKPVIIGMKTRKNFHIIPTGSEYWWANKGNTTSAGGHALTVVGYNEAKKAFEVMNSWGKEWGNDGFIWIKYDDFGRFCKYAYQLHLTTETVMQEGKKEQHLPESELGGSFAFKSLVDFEDDRPIFKKQEVDFDNNFYTLNKDDWQIGDLFQLFATNTSKDAYVYVFSFDTKDELTIHWPRQNILNTKFVDINETALIPMANAEVVIPSRETAMSINHLGTDYLCVLFSSKKIEDIKELTNQISQQSNQDFVANLFDILGNRLVPRKQIVFSKNKMEFTAKTGNNGYIVPIVLQVDSGQ